MAIFKLELMEYHEETREGKLTVSCSKGTYIRTLIADLAKAQNDDVLGFLDDQIKPGTLVCGISVLGPVSDYTRYEKDWFFLAVGDNRLRESLTQKLRDVRWYTAIHPSAFVSEDSVIGAGSVVLPQAVVHRPG